jgi:hypothetical protein
MKLKIAGLIVVAVVATAAAIPVALAASGKQIVPLKPTRAFPAAKGKAKFEAKNDERQLEVEVEHVRRLKGQRVTVFVGGTKIGSVRVNAFGAAEIERNSERGQAVPRVAAGTKVVVRTARATAIVKGSF